MDAELKALEGKVDQLVELTQRQRDDNRGLRQQLAHAINENKRLGEKVDAAKVRLEALLEHLPEGEQ
jgi:cell division protein ZapB